MTPRRPPYPLSVAPMMDWTDRHYRAFMRGVTRRTLLYTEMVHVNAVLRGDRERVLGFSEFEKPLALQLGGTTRESSPRARASPRTGATANSTSTSGARRRGCSAATSAPA